MAFAKTVKYTTPDGVDHDTAEAAHRHMFALNFSILGAATSSEFEATTADVAGIVPATKPLRDAVRDVYLEMWPRASKGKPREKKASTATAETPAAATEPVDPGPASETVAETQLESPPTDEHTSVVPLNKKRGSR